MLYKSSESNKNRNGREAAEKKKTEWEEYDKWVISALIIIKFWSAEKNAPKILEIIVWVYSTEIWKATTIYY